MGRNVQVCATCTQNCLLFHGTAKPSPTSFFKVMADDDYFRVLYIPPKFSSTVSPLVNKKIILKDSSGQQWNVTVSNVDGSLAFGEGWNVFSMDHGLKVGYFLVFNYINELHFDVKIYDNSGCERLDFSKKRNQKKRSRDSSGSPVSDGMLFRQDPNSSDVSKQGVPKMKSQHREDDIGGTRNNIENISKHDGNSGRAQSVCISEDFEDPSHMTNREFEDKERDDNACGVDGTMKFTTGSHVDYGSHIYQNDATKCNNKDPMFEGVLGTGSASDASEFEISGRNNSLGETDKGIYDKSSTLKPEVKRENKSIMSKRKVQEFHFAEGLESEQAVISKKKHALHNGGFHKTKQMFDGISTLSGEMKKVPVDMTPTSCNLKDKLIAKGEISKKIKKELVTSDVYNDKDELGATGLPKVIKEEWDHSSHTFNQDNGSHFKTAATFSCVVPADSDCLKLPVRLPLSRRGRGQIDRMVVFLRDPLRRLWPVLYHEQPWFKILANGWLDFRKANNIQPEDVCTFGVENESEHIVAVDIVHK